VLLWISKSSGLPLANGAVAISRTKTQFYHRVPHELKKPTFALPKIKAMAKKGDRIQVIMECTEHKASGMPGTSRYITKKNRKNTPERIELKKYNPILKKVTVHKEIK